LIINDYKTLDAARLLKARSRLLRVQHLANQCRNILLGKWFECKFSYACGLIFFLGNNNGIVGTENSPYLHIYCTKTFGQMRRTTISLSSTSRIAFLGIPHLLNGQDYRESSTSAGLAYHINSTTMFLDDFIADR
jgi:hypothetical protein